MAKKAKKAKKGLKWTLPIAALPVMITKGVTISRPKRIHEIINPTPKQIEELFIPILRFSPKLLLTGSLVLSMLGLLQRTPEDIDFGLTEKLTENELAVIMDFFQLKLRSEMKGWKGHYDQNNNPIGDREEIVPTTAELVDKDMILLYHDVLGSNGITTRTKIDIFNKEYIQPKNIIKINHADGEFNAIHPSIPISYKARYAFDPRVSSNMKHQDDIKDLLLNREKYFKVIKKDS